jgi:hypothetical protein
MPERFIPFKSGAAAAQMQLKSMGGITGIAAVSTNNQV